MIVSVSKDTLKTVFVSYFVVIGSAKGSYPAFITTSKAEAIKFATMYKDLFGLAEIEGIKSI